MGLYHSPRIVTNGLFFAFDAGNKKAYSGSGTSCSDLIGNKIGTIVNSPTFSATDSGGSFTFTSAGSSYIDFGDIFDNAFSAGYTFQAWVNITDYSQYNRVFTISDAPETYYQYWIQTNSTTGVIESGSGFDIYARGSTAVGIGTWVNIAATCNYGASSIKIYLNGVSDTIGTTLGTPAYTASVGKSYIGRLNFAGSPNYSNFKLSNLQVYNRALSADEIKQNFNTLRGRFSI